MSSNAIRQKHRRTSASPSLQFIQTIGKVAGGTLLGIVMLGSAIVAGGLVGLAISFRNLPDVRALKTFAPAETTYIYDIEGNHLASIHDEANREVLPLDRFSPNLKRSILAIEDSHFYQHQGINPTSIVRALLVNLGQGETAEGGSTLTMQLVKNIFLTPERTISRKVAEAVLALRLEQTLEKDEILEMT
ncbi:transglycosylase domain-containing protein [Trichothermofontia sp.]